MDTYYQHLQSLFEQLKSTSLCVDKQPTHENISEFVKILNLTIPINDDSKSMQSVMMVMFNKNRTAFINYLNISRTPYLSLILNGEIIAHFLNLMCVVYIKFDNNSNTYLVTPFHSKRQQNNTANAKKYTNNKYTNNKYTNNKYINNTIPNNLHTKPELDNQIPTIKFATIDPELVRVEVVDNEKKSKTALDMLMDCSWSDNL